MEEVDTIIASKKVYIELLGQVELYRHHLNEHLEERTIPYEQRLQDVEAALDQARVRLQSEEDEEAQE